jgi:hypothetical protein
MVPSEPRKKSPTKPPGIDPETLRLVVQCLNHYATPGPVFSCVFRSTATAPICRQNTLVYREGWQKQFVADIDLMAGLALKWQGSLCWECAVPLSADGWEGHQLWSVQADNETGEQSNCKSFTFNWLTWKGSQVCLVELLCVLWYVQWSVLRIAMSSCSRLCDLHLGCVISNICTCSTVTSQHSFECKRRRKVFPHYFLGSY